MWTWVDGAEGIAAEPGFAVGNAVSWLALTEDFDGLLPALPADFVGSVDCAVDEHGGGVVEGMIVRILMVTGRRRMVGYEITATPAEHVHVLDLAGFLVELDSLAT